ncbi:sulfite exporter TauE/SafE family protein [uncultured Oxalicibacterium sp.]|uniref:sulfite exporter TauE/SafE family protein n=1 Tax=uncultured Oxalicibacterium sp. TaxID=1168540 RepID=UPI0025FDE507|nr:sulfite exporter TauE/SafE family protein [uncultured Oxalicibacterium sp.]
MSGYLFVLLVGLAAGVISGIVGTGSSIMLLPVLVYTFGPIEAVPIMAIAAVLANLSRVIAWWSMIDWRAVAAYSVTGMPAAALGARTLLSLPDGIINLCLGVFFIAMVPVRHWLKAHAFRLRLWQLSLAGLVVGYLTGLVLSTGPLSVPAFSAYGLVKGAFLSTEAASSFMLYLSKLFVFGEFGALPLDIIIKGLVVGSSIMAGTFIGKIVMLKMSEQAFQYLLDALLFCSGLSLLWAAIKSSQ